MRNNLIIKAFTNTAGLADLSLRDWDQLVRQARAAKLLATLYARLEKTRLLESVPEQARRHLVWEHAVAARHTLAVQQEIILIRRALAGIPVILLKGAAYVMAELPAAQGRIFTDVDILVSKTQLNQVEAALMLHGWASTHHDAYDQHYYRAWMHELPPMQHIKRLTVIDVHHAILPETAALHPDPHKLRAAACKLGGYDDQTGASAPLSPTLSRELAREATTRSASTGLFVLAPADMLLHSATHLFHGGELEHGLRDLLDIDSLLRDFGRNPGFWPHLQARARELELTRPLFYALRYSASLLQTPIPQQIIDDSDAPNRLLLPIMDTLFCRALLPDHTSCNDLLSSTARRLLYVRANWQRMPPLLLARHLFHKAFLSPRER